MGWSGGLDAKESACNAGDQGSVAGSGRYPGEGNGYPHQYSFLENSMDRGDWQATVHGLQRVAHNWTQAHTHTHIHKHTQNWNQRKKTVGKDELLSKN